MQTSINTLRTFKFGPNPTWNPCSPAEDQETETPHLKIEKNIPHMSYQSSATGDSDKDGFIKIETKNRLNLFRALKEQKEEAVLEENTHNKQNEVVTINTVYRRSKKRWRYYNHKQPVQVKTKFESVAQVRSEWQKVARLDFAETKEVIEPEVTVLKEALTEDRKFRSELLKSTAKKPGSVKQEQEGIEPPHTIENDEFLQNLFQTEEVPEGKTGLFMSENVFYTLNAIKLARFPFLFTADRVKNKIKIGFAVRPDNCFAFLESYRESTSENYIKDEKKIQQLSSESTQVHQAFQANAINCGSEKTYSKNANYR